MTKSLRNIRFEQEMPDGSNAPLVAYAWQGDSEHFMVPLHWHDDVEILVIESGACMYRSAHKTFEVRAPAVILVPGGCLHGFTMQGYGTERVIRFDPAMLMLKVPDESQIYCKTMLCDEDRREVILKPEVKNFEEIFALCRSVAQRALDESALSDARFLLIKADLIRIAALLCNEDCLKAARITASPARKEQERRIKKLIAYVAAHYPYPIGIEDAAKACNLSSNYLSEYFSRTLNLTFSEYLLRYRLKMASQLLLSTRDPIEEIMVRCGFENKSYFFRRFKEVFGLTPLRHRKERQTKRVKDCGDQAREAP